MSRLNVSEGENCARSANCTRCSGPGGGSSDLVNLSNPFADECNVMASRMGRRPLQGKGVVPLSPHL